MALANITNNILVDSGILVGNLTPTSRNITINGVTYDLSADRSWSIATHDAVTIGTANGLSLSGQALSLALASGSTTGALSSTDWTTFNNKQSALTNPVTGTGTTNYLPKFTGTSTIGNSQVYDNGNGIAFNGTNISYAATNRGNITINGTSGIIGFNNSGTAMGYFFHDGTNMQMWNELSGSLIFGNSATTRMTLNASGNLSIGNTNDTYKLDVSGTLRATGAATFSSSVTANDTVSVVKSKSGTGVESYNLLTLRLAGTGAIGDSGNIAWRSNDGSYTIASIGGISGADNVAYGSISFSTRNYFTDSLVEVMRINNRGNLGIGTSNPQGGNGSTDRTLSINSGSGAASFVTGLVGDVKYSTLFTASSIVVLETNAAIPLAFNTNSAERMRITSSGNVGIGTTSPGADLHIYRAGSTAGTTIGLKVNHECNAVDYVVLFTGNESDANNRFVMTQPGNIGIGTTSPANLLHLVGGSATPSLRLGSTSLDYYWDIGRENATTGDFVFNNANGGSSTEKIRITVGGNVEINTGSIKTGAPTNGTAQPWKLGNAVSGAISTDSYIIVSVNGVTYSIPALNGLP